MHHLPRFYRSLLLILPLAALLLSACVPKLNPQFSHQGRLLDDSGVPVADGDYEVVYSLYQVATGGTSVYSETQTVPVEDGLFTTSIGFSSYITPTLFAQPTWLEISVDGETLTPRQRMQGAPYAFSLSSGSVVQGVETINRDYLTFTDTGSALTAINIDGAATGGHAMVAINSAAATGTDRADVAALYARAGGGEFDTSDADPETGSSGAIISSDNYVGMWVTAGVDAANTNSGFYAAVFNSPVGINLIGGGSCSGCALAYVAQNTGTAPIAAGDFVAVSNVTVDADLRIPVMQVRKATSAADNVIGVAANAMERSDVTHTNGLQSGGYGPLAGPAAAGDYVTVIVQGLVQARAADAGLQPGAAVTVGADGVSAASGSGIARAMSAVDANGMVWVMVGSAPVGAAGGQ